MDLDDDQRQATCGDLPPHAGRPDDPTAVLRALLADEALARRAARRGSTMLTVGEILRGAVETLWLPPVPSDA